MFSITSAFFFLIVSPNFSSFKNKGSNDSAIIFLSPEADVLESVEEAREYILSHTANKQQYLENIKKLTNFLNTIITITNSDDSKLEWKCSETVPDGWKVKVSNPKHVLSPDGRQFRNTKKIIQCMVKESWRLKDLDFMRSRLSLDGWSLDPRLPTGWAMLVSPNNDCIRYISSCGEELRSTRAAVKYLKERNGTDSDVRKLQSLLRIKMKNV